MITIKFYLRNSDFDIVDIISKEVPENFTKKQILEFSWENVPYGYKLNFNNL